MNSWPFKPLGMDETEKAKPMRPQPGSGTRVTAATPGFAYSVPHSRAKYPHPFKPTLAGLGVSFSKGLVNDREPKIRGVPISGAGKPIPALFLEAGIANENGESWCCVEATLDDKGEITKESLLEIVHVKEPRSIDPLLARAPVALILWQNKKPVKALEIVFFNLSYARVMPPAGAGSVRHVFY